jgi:hypothetical protein
VAPFLRCPNIYSSSQNPRATRGLKTTEVSALSLWEDESSLSGEGERTRPIGAELAGPMLSRGKKSERILLTLLPREFTIKKVG